MGVSPIAADPSPSSLTAADRRRLDTHLDALRGLAALMVASMHIREIAWIGERAYWHLHGWIIAPAAVLAYATFPLLWGSIGVPVFFVISGYCIHRSQAFARTHDGSFGLSSFDFYVRRFLRIYPVLVAALFVTLACDSISHHYFPNSYKLRDTGAVSFLVNFLSLQGIAGGAYGSNRPLWTLALEVQFYCLYPLLLMLMARLGYLRTLVGLVVLNAMSYLTLDRHGYAAFSSYYVSWYLGVLIAEAEARGLLSDRLKARTTRTVLYAAAALIFCLGNAVYFFWEYAAFQIWAAAFAILLSLILGRGRKDRGIPIRVLQWFGSFSYSIYIVHLPIGVLICSMLFNSRRQESIASFFVVFGVTVGAAYLFSIIFEKPALALTRSFRRRRLDAKSPS